MNVQEKGLFKEKVREVLLDHKGLLPDRVKAADYIDLYEPIFSPTLDILVESLDELFEMKLKDKGLVRWEE